MEHTNNEQIAKLSEVRELVTRAMAILGDDGIDRIDFGKHACALTRTNTYTPSIQAARARLAEALNAVDDVNNRVQEYRTQARLAGFCQVHR